MDNQSKSAILTVDQLREIDLAITAEATKLRQLAHEVHFQPILEFELGNTIPVIPDNVFHKKGVYLFEIKNKNVSIDKQVWVDTFSQLWKETDVIWVPGIKKRRINFHEKFDEWIPLYIGKSKNVGGRISEHISQRKDRRTFSMKLQARVNLHGEILRISWQPLDVFNYDMIAPAIESFLREILNPITGKQ